MPIIYPLQTTTGGGNATSIGDIPVDISGLQPGHVIKYSQDQNKWVNGNPPTAYYFTVLGIPTNASSTLQQELTRFSGPFGSQNVAENNALVGTYSILNGQTGSVVVSSSAGEFSTLLSGTDDAQPFVIYFPLSGTIPHKIFASSSNVSSDFKIYNLTMEIAF
jgi:hypothetical protein